jgi:hypothetical protein
MRKKMLARSLVTFLYLSAMGAGGLNAQPATTPESIRGQLTQALGAPRGSLEVSTSTNLLTIRRINTDLNASNHSHRNQEAERIARVVSEAIKGLPNYSKILAINVEYIKRSAAGGRDQLIDRIDLRKNPDGSFTVHVT